MGVDPRLVEIALREIRSAESETGEALRLEETIEVVLGLFTISDEFKSVVVGGDYALDDCLPTYDSAAELAAAMAKANQADRAMEHRFVATTDWERVEAHISWEPAS